MLVYPNPAESWWRGETIATFVRELRTAAEAPVALGGRPGRVAGGPALSFDIISSMVRDGPMASLLAFLGVVATVLLIFRRSLATPFVIGSLMVGVLWLLAVTMKLGIKINFVNFIAFPITFGIGVDYAVNVMARYLRDGGRDVVAAVRGTGGAVGLCSLTTVIGYSSLLVAQNVGLFLFGLLAVFGEICCLTTAVIVLPAVLTLVRPRSSPKLPEIPWDSATAGRERERERRRGRPRWRAARRARELTRGSQPAEGAAGEDQRGAPDAGGHVVEHHAGAAAQALRRAGRPGLESDRRDETPGHRR